MPDTRITKDNVNIEKNDLRSCVNCGSTKCKTHQGEFPEFCLTEALTDEEIATLAAIYNDPDTQRLARTAAEVEGAFYGRYTRVEETIEFARRMGYKRLGIATCAGLLEESRILARILQLNGFEVFSAMCKVGSMSKIGQIGLDPVYTSISGDVMCNPILQAQELMHHEVDLAIMMGLCVGHDTLFYQHFQGPITTLVVKDRVLGNNPVQALYLTRSYYKRLLAQPVSHT